MESVNQSELVYEFEDRPLILETVLASTQHLPGSFIGIMIRMLVLAGILLFEAKITHLISMSFIASGLCAVIQT